MSSRLPVLVLLLALAPSARAYSGEAPSSSAPQPGSAATPSPQGITLTTQDAFSVRVLADDSAPACSLSATHSCVLPLQRGFHTLEVGDARQTVSVGDGMTEIVKTTRPIRLIPYGASLMLLGAAVAGEGILFAVISNFGGDGTGSIGVGKPITAAGLGTIVAGLLVIVFDTFLPRDELRLASRKPAMGALLLRGLSLETTPTGLRGGAAFSW